MKDIGSIFPIYDLHPNDKHLSDDGRQYFSLCREILIEIAKKYEYSNKIVLLPAFTCKVVIEPFEQLGWKICYYSVRKNLRINAESFKHNLQDHIPTLIVVHPFFGMELNYEEDLLMKEAKRIGSDIVLDNTQCLYSQKEYLWADYVVASLRKWIPIPDGAYVDSQHKFCPCDLTNDQYLERELDAMYLRGVYYQNDDEVIKAISRRLDAEAIAMLDGDSITPHRISDFSRKVIANTDFDCCAKICMQNFKYLHSNIHSQAVVPIIGDVDSVTSAPLMVPVFVQDRVYVQRKLALEHIYAQYLWPKPNLNCIVDDDVKYIYDHHLVFFVDQRYDENDMQRIVKIVNKL